VCPENRAYHSNKNLEQHLPDDIIDLDYFFGRNSDQIQAGVTADEAGQYTLPETGGTSLGGTSLHLLLLVLAVLLETHVQHLTAAAALPASCGNPL
jgi:hypothetical protein